MIREHFLTTADHDSWRKHVPASRSVFGSLGYARICQAFRGFSPRLYIVESGEDKICYPLLLRPLSDLPFLGVTQAKWDAIAPEYTGPLVSGSGSDLANSFPNLRNALFEKEGVVAEFAHLHPWSPARTVLGEGSSYNRDIVWVDTSLSPEELWRDHIKLQCRQKIKQAKREGVRIITASVDDHVREFHRIYSDTMKRNEAEASYYFSFEFFRAFREELPENSRFVLAEYRDQIVAGTLCLYDGDDAFYFLAGTDAAFRHVRPSNAVVWELIHWAHEAGIQRLILGGGYRPDDGIFRFKSTFSRLRQPFYVYKHIHLPEDYALLEQRFREHSRLTGQIVDYFPIYRYRSVAALTIEDRVGHVGPASKQENEAPVPSGAQNFAPWPHFAEDEVEAAAAVLRSGRVNYWTGDEGVSSNGSLRTLRSANTPWQSLTVRWPSSWRFAPWGSVGAMM